MGGFGFSGSSRTPSSSGRSKGLGGLSSLIMGGKDSQNGATGNSGSKDAAGLAGIDLGNSIDIMFNENFLKASGATEEELEMMEALKKGDKDKLKELGYSEEEIEQVISPFDGDMSGLMQLLGQ